MADTYVTKAELKDNKIVLTVQVDDFTAGGAVEISGQATQNNAVIAIFSEMQNLPDPASGGPKYLTVTADRGDAGKFDAEQDVTVVARVARVWATVLEPGRSDAVAWKEKAANSPAPPNGDAKNW